MTSAADLYGIRKPKNTTKEISSSTGLAFSSTLSSLISSNNSTSQTTSGRLRPSKTKPDIFTSHNKNAKKRAAKDLEEGDPHRQNASRNIGTIDTSDLHRSKRKLVEKSKLYSAMRKGEHFQGENDPDSIVDFDRKWVELQDQDAECSDEIESDDGHGEMVDYEDEYGRARRGTKSEAERIERIKANKALGAEELNRMSARPAMPSGLIYGDTIQTAAFNPDEPVMALMEELAKKRDRSMTPPEAKHYEADKEFRTKGVGFYSFSKDEGVREKEMRALEEERLETERVRREREERKERRRREVENRRRVIGEKRAKKLADTFLDGLG